MSKVYWRLAKTNLKNNKRLYLPYILSGIMMVTMFYLMLFLNNNKGLSVIPGSTALQSLMALGVAVVAIFAYIFLFYTNSFIIKRRKKEIGVYNILGMEKRHIAKVLFMETLVVAAVSILGGLGLGVLFSRLMLMLLYRILGFGESIVFSVTVDGMVITLLLFGILYLLILLYNMMQIKLANPVELLHGGNVGEKEPKTKVLMTLAGISCLGVAYYISFVTEKPMEVIGLFFVAVLLVIVGTYFLFIAGSIAILKGLRKNKKFYYQKKHFSSVSGMLYRMKQNAAGLASICILCTMVLVMVSTTVSMFAGVNDELVARFPMDVCVYSEYDSPVDTKDLENNTADFIHDQGRVITKQVSYSYFGIWAKHDGTNYTSVSGKRYDGSQTMLNIITRENMLEMGNDLTKADVPELSEGSVWILGNKDYAGKEITIAGQTYPVAGKTNYTAQQDLYAISTYDALYYVVVDSQETLEKLFTAQKTVKPDAMFTYQNMTGFDMDGTKQEKMDCADVIKEKTAAENYDHCINSYTENRQNNEAEFYSLYGGLFFLGLFLGVMFLMVTVMIIFYKQLSEGYDDRERYKIMEQVGMSSDEVKTSIGSQVRMVFFLPILMAGVHVAAAFPMIRRILALLNLTNVKLFVICILITMLVFAVIYYIVFKLTSRIYYKIVGNQV